MTQLHKISLILFILLGAFSYGQKQKKKNYKHIMESTDIELIQSFLDQAHPDDTRIPILKNRIIQIKNLAWRKPNAGPAMAARPVEKDSLQKNNPNSTFHSSQTLEEREKYNQLIKEQNEHHAERTVDLLNKLFNEDLNSDETILLIQNNTDCNIVVKASGSIEYNLAIPAHGENSLVLKKGFYTLSSKVCNSNYSSSRNISANQIITLNSPTLSK